MFGPVSLAVELCVIVLSSVIFVEGSNVHVIPEFIDVRLPLS